MGFMLMLVIDYNYGISETPLGCPGDVEVESG
jgi:hypothetical protein